MRKRWRVKEYTNTNQYVNYEWGAGYLESGKSGSEGGSRKPTACSGKAPFPYPAAGGNAAEEKALKTPVFSLIPALRRPSEALRRSVGLFLAPAFAIIE